ncbi:B-block binding subunit of TFIIIC [Neofusicoccum parvum]|nr:B-block binding subunit of TFIIIC [Neofusicoccum parvum]
MPHKHKRKVRDDDEYGFSFLGPDAPADNFFQSFDLPPTSRAKSLPVRESGTLSENFASKTKQRKDKKKAKRIEGYGADDTPKAFARLMQFSKTGKGFKGLDDGVNPRGKKRKTNGGAKKDAQEEEPSKPVSEVPKILPGERMSDFKARVDQALPVAGLARKGKSIEGFKERQTKTEKRIQKMISQWREEEEKIKEREQEEKDLAEIEEDEEQAMWEDKTAPIPTQGGGKKKGKRKGGDDEDPWAVLKAKRDEPKGLNDVAQAPPTFKAIPKEKFKVKNGAKVQVADIPNAAGSLRRREELGEARKSIIENYRAMMAAKKNGP